jgi:carbon starvation protein CstA
MKASTKRIILRIVHLVAVIPVLGYVYQPLAEAAEYQRFTQLAFIPLAILTGYWMYMGVVWGVIGAASWVALNILIGGNNGFGIALLAQIAIFVARYILKTTQRRES